MKTGLKQHIGWLLCMIAAAVVGCTRDSDLELYEQHWLAFSTDTVAFDTLFTHVNSATRTLLVYNHSDADLCIANVSLAGGEKSPYRVNIDGLAGTTFSNLTLRKADSMYVFVEVTVPPRNQDIPFQVCDSLCFLLDNGVEQQVIFTAGGQDANVMRGAVIDTDTYLTARRPYLIYDSLRINATATLYIAPGTRLYLADGVEIQAYGRIEAVGTADSLILFRGARTDNMFSYLPYDRLSAQWGGITLHESSTDNVFVHCDIHSGTYGLRAKATDIDRHKLVMQASQIHNVDEDALQLTACRASFVNSLFTNAGGHCVDILGGQMDFLHCTIANFYPWKSERGTALHIANYMEEENTLYPLMGVNFINCIITGSKDDELEGTVVEKSDTADWSEYAQYTFAHSLINSRGEAHTPDTLHFTHITWEHRDSTSYASSNFADIDHSNFVYDFHLDSLSIARGIATDAYLDIAPYDKDEKPRPSSNPDAGCYQYTDDIERN